MSKTTMFSPVRRIAETLGEKVVLPAKLAEEIIVPFK